MNVTVKLEDRLIREARHLAVDAGMSLSTWLASLIEREVRPGGSSGGRPDRLLDLLGDESGAAEPFEAPRVIDAPLAARFEES